MSDRNKYFAAALLLGVGVFIYSFKKPAIQKLTYQQFLKLTAISEPILVTAVPRAQVFKPTLKTVSSFTFGNQNGVVKSFSRNIQGQPEQGLIVTDTEMAEHASQLVTQIVSSDSISVYGTQAFPDLDRISIYVIYLNEGAKVNGVSIMPETVLVAKDLKAINVECKSYSMQAFVQGKPCVQSVISQHYQDLHSYNQDSKVHCFTFTTVGSTMDVAKEFPHKEAYLLNDFICAFTSFEQTKGRGQRQNTWASPEGGNLYVTFLVLTKTAPHWASLIVALSLCQTLNQFGISSKQKWINDIYVDDKKVAGILCECATSRLGYELSIGVGVNLVSCPDGCAVIPTISRQELLDALAQTLRANVLKADQGQAPQMFKSIAFQHFGQHVQILDHTLTHVLDEGIFEGVNEFGHALIRLADGSVKAVFEGRMRQ